jgi:hypothetical protein
MSRGTKRPVSKILSENKLLNNSGSSKKKRKRRRRKKLSNNTNNIKVYKDWRSKDNSTENWYVCLVSVRERQSLDNFLSPKKLDKRCTNKTNRTRIYTTKNPQEMLNSLKMTKSKTSSSHHNSVLSSSSSYTKRVSSPELVCIIGPVNSEENAAKLEAGWVKLSRGLQSRAVTGAIIAKYYNLDSTINWYSFYRLDENEVFIEESYDDDGNLVLSYYEKTDQNKRSDSNKH